MKLYDISSFLLSLLPPQNPPSHPKHPFMYSHSDPSNFPSGSGIYSAQLNLTITCRFDLTCCFRLLLEFPTIDCAPHTHARTHALASLLFSPWTHSTARNVCQRQVGHGLACCRLKPFSPGNLFFFLIHKTFSLSKYQKHFSETRLDL